ncbi:hypothetical protein [Sphingomonas sp. LHG3406-1]|uniref:hypothetical protein n=1 Tax=Sphingomonas sp. LHG3406-1 TaxID=2804617 RepID=UPI002612DEC4|nr:hypothetical protein [Sphingomonas sp. LHG3406-1]
MTSTPDQRRARMTAVCGWLILLVAAAALLLPEVAASSGALVVGELLLLAGALEVVAAAGRQRARVPSTLAGVATLIAGGLFIARDETRFLPNITVIIFWLLLRVAALTLATIEGGRSGVRRWTGIAAATDLALAAILISGLTLASIIVALFGTTSELVATFSWILALSFMATGAMLLQIAACEREGEP